jgi:hypothetical protein
MVSGAGFVRWIAVVTLAGCVLAGCTTDSHVTGTGTVVSIIQERGKGWGSGNTWWGKAQVQWPDGDSDWLKVTTQIDFESLHLGQTVGVEDGRIVRVIKDVG